jgi:predicted nucleic acid-binding protein
VSHESIFLSVITLVELRRGIQLLPQGKRREALDEWLLNDVAEAYEGRILPVTAAIADLAGRVAAAAKQDGYTVELADVLIAATARVHGLAVVTLNRKHFERLGVELVEF